MLNPDMSEKAESSLYTDIQNMYSTYLDPNGPEYLNLPEDISIGIRRSKSALRLIFTTVFEKCVSCCGYNLRYAFSSAKRIETNSRITDVEAVLSSASRSSFFVRIHLFTIISSQLPGKEIEGEQFFTSQLYSSLTIFYSPLQLYDLLCGQPVSDRAKQISRARYDRFFN